MSCWLEGRIIPCITGSILQKGGTLPMEVKLLKVIERYQVLMLALRGPALAFTSFLYKDEITKRVIAAHIPSIIQKTSQPVKASNPTAQLWTAGIGCNVTEGGGGGGNTGI